MMKSTRSHNKKKRKRSSAQKAKKEKQHDSSNSSESAIPELHNHNIKTEEGKKNNDEHELSLATRLKRIRGTAATTPLPPEWSGLSSSESLSSSNKRKKYLTPSEDGDEFLSCHKQSYNGFCWDDPGEIPQSTHDKFDKALNSLNEAGMFLYDVVQPGGKKSTFTFVSRTLIGNPGSTYKYLGLRLFSHPWCAVDGDGDPLTTKESKPKKGEYNSMVQLGYSKECAKALILIGQLNQSLVERTKDKLDTEVRPNVKDGLVGSAEFTITLINKMEPTNVKKDLKNENIHGLGKTSVSWHKDSGLQDFSSIAVYHTFESTSREENKDEIPWTVALRVADQNTQTPALSVPLASGACYYLLDDFNHQHEHAVISGSDTLRFSSTHRVAKDGLTGTWPTIRDKTRIITSSNLCSSLAKGDTTTILTYNSTPLKKKLVKEFRSYHSLMNELEFEWIRMWNIQGQVHAKLHVYWHEPIEQMKKSYIQLKKVNSTIYAMLRKTNYEELPFLCEEFFDVLIEAVETRNKLETSWAERLNDKIFGRMPKKMRPIACATFENENCESLPTSKEVRKWRSDFVLKQNVTISSSQKPRKKMARLTKKESKKVQSNWQRLKSSIKKK